MTYLKQFLLIVLVLSTLGYSSAWAFDEHVMEELETSFDSGNNDGNTTASEDSHHGKTDAEVICDHCCHISSHLVAIFIDANSHFINSTSTSLPTLKENHISFIVSPDLKPPRV